MISDILTTLAVLPVIGPIFRGPANMARQGQMSFGRAMRVPQLMLMPLNAWCPVT